MQKFFFEVMPTSISLPLSLNRAVLGSYRCQGDQLTCSQTLTTNSTHLIPWGGLPRGGSRKLERGVHKVMITSYRGTPRIHKIDKRYT